MHRFAIRLIGLDRPTVRVAGAPVDNLGVCQSEGSVLPGESLFRRLLPYGHFTRPVRVVDFFFFFFFWERSTFEAEKEN